jgi:hypothetical protein
MWHFPTEPTKEFTLDDRDETTTVTTLEGYEKYSVADVDSWLKNVLAQLKGESKKSEPKVGEKLSLVPKQ